MYKGFNLTFSFEHDDYFEKGNVLYEEKRTEMRKTLESFINPSGSINASALQESWFPQIEVDIFYPTHIEIKKRQFH